jgi:hypothetical protein
MHYLVMLEVLFRECSTSLVSIMALNYFTMRTIQISITDLESDRFGIYQDALTFTEFVELIGRELMRQNLNKCVELAERHGLSSMTMDDINEEVKAVRHAKSRN